MGRIGWAAFAALGLGMACTVARRSEVAPGGATAPETAGAGRTASEVARWTTAVEPKALSTIAEKGLEWLVRHQQDDGGWAQGEESQNMRGGAAGQLDRSNVADTCMAALALVRAGSTPSSGRHAQQIERAVGFVCKEIEASDADSMSVTSVQGTRVQMKIGQHVDTFAAAMLLPEVKGRMSGAAANARVDTALAKVLGKIAKHQNQSGGWDDRGWAPMLSQSLGGKGINRAAQAGVELPIGLLARSEEHTSAGPGEAAPASAGVSLYAVAGTTGNAQDFLNTSYVRERDLKAQLGTVKDEAERGRLSGELKKIDDSRVAFAQQQEGLVARIDDPQFIAGFGSNGGEEFLSYMNISESLVVRADGTWKRWDDAVSGNLGRVQNEDGSWTGHHCITGRTFCTASALLTLLADRAPVPVEVVAARK